MAEDDDSAHEQADPGACVLLMKTWSDGEAEMVRQLLDSYGIQCQVVSDVTHTVLPVSVDGLGEVRILVSPLEIDEAREVLAEHRRQGLEIVPSTEEEPSGGKDGA